MGKFIFVLVLFVLVNALGVVYVRHQNRVEFVALQTLMAERDRLNIEWSQLLLEQATQARHDRIDHNAQTKLNMIRPSAERVITLHVPAASGE